MRFLIALAVIAIVVMSYYLAAIAWPATQLRQAYLPQLEAMAQRDSTDGRILALLGARLMEAKEFPAAADRLEHALAAGEKTDSVWLCLAACKAAIGDQKWHAYLQVGVDSTDGPQLREAVVRVDALPKDAAPLAIAAAISPRGANPLLDRYARGSLLNPVATRLDSLHPEQSGYATRQYNVKTKVANAEAERLWGLALLTNRRFPEAIDALKEASSLSPDSAPIPLALAQAYDGIGAFGDACLEYIACLKIAPNDLQALIGLGTDAIRVQMPASAVGVFQKATRVGPQSADAWIGLGRACLAATRDYDTALTAFQTASKLAPERSDFTDDYASALINNNRWQDAEEMLRKYLQTNPEDASARFQLGTILLDNNPTPARLQEAMTDTQQAIQEMNVTPIPGAVRQQLAVILMRQNRVPEALSLLKQIVTDEPANTKALLSLSRAYRQAGQLTESDVTAHRAADISQASNQIAALRSQSLTHPSDPVLHQRLAELYAQVGLTSKAADERKLAEILQKNQEKKQTAPQTLQSMISDAIAGH